MTTPNDRLELLEEFTRAWAACDIDALMGLMSEDCVFRASVGPEPGESFLGPDAVRAGFERFLAPPGPDSPETVSAPTLVCSDFAVTRWELRWPDGRDPVLGCDVFEFSGDRISLKDTYRKAMA